MCLWDFVAHSAFLVYIAYSPHAETFFNQTVWVVEPEQLFDFDLIRLYFLMIGAALAIGKHIHSHVRRGDILEIRCSLFDVWALFGEGLRYVLSGEDSVLELPSHNAGTPGIAHHGIVTLGVFLGGLVYFRTVAALIVGSRLCFRSVRTVDKYIP